MAARIAALVVGSMLWISALHAQTPPVGTGTIQGHVYNPAQQAYVRDAEVRLESTGQVTYTENDGSFRFDGVPAGTQTIIISYTGYNTIRDTFVVTAGQTVSRDHNIVSAEVAAPKPSATSKDGVVQLEAVTVSSERDGNAKAIMAQRRNMNITTSVSSDIFGEVADGNVGEFLKYLPGVDLDYVESEARGPRLGGMDGQYVGVSFDGMRGASADANRGGGAASRATSFEGFSITAIDSIEINYTASPENDADSPAGIVNMKTKRAFDRKGRVFSYNVGVNMNGEEWTLRKTFAPAEYKEEKWKPNYSFDYAESFFDRRLGVLMSASTSNSFTEQQMVTNTYNTGTIAASSTRPADDRPMVIRQIDTKDGPKNIHKDAYLVTVDWRATERLVLSMNFNYSYFDGEFWNRNFTWVAANDNSNVNNGRATVGGDGVTTVIATRAPSGSVNNVATLNNGGGSSAKLVYTRQFAPRFEYRLGSVIVDGALGISNSKNNYESVERGFSNNEGNGVPSSWIATRDNPRSAEWSIRQTSGGDWFDMNSFTSTDTRSGGTRITNDDRTWITEKWTGILNARAPVPFMKAFPTVVKIGGKWDEETRTNNTWSDVDVWTYVGPGGNTVTQNASTGAWQNTAWGNWANLGPDFIAKNPYELGRLNALTVYNINGVAGMPPRADRNAMARLFREHPEQFVNTSTPENWYQDYVVNARHLRQTVSAGYFQADMRITPKLQTRWGMRMEETETKAREWQPRGRADVIAAGYAVNAPGTNSGRPLTIPGMYYQYMTLPQFERKANYQNWFPSAVVKYQIRPNFDWQTGWNKAIGRPAIDDLTGVWSINESNSTVTISNPALKPEIHEKIQSRLAYYFTGRAPGQFTLSFAQVNSKNFVTNRTFTAEQLGITDPDYVVYQNWVTKVNTPGTVRYRTMDVAYNQTLGFLPSPYLRGISVGVNYTRGYASQRRQGLAPHRISGRLGYNYKGFGASFGIIWADDKPESSTYGRYQGQVTKVDLGFTYRINRNVQLYAQGRNIADMPDRWYQSPAGYAEGKNGYLRQIEKYGSNWVFGVKGTF